MATTTEIIEDEDDDDDQWPVTNIWDLVVSVKELRRCFLVVGAHETLNFAYAWRNRILAFQDSRTTDAYRDILSNNYNKLRKLQGLKMFTWRWGMLRTIDLEAEVAAAPLAIGGFPVEAANRREAYGTRDGGVVVEVAVAVNFGDFGDVE